MATVTTVLYSVHCLVWDVDYVNGSVALTNILPWPHAVTTVLYSVHCLVWDVDDVNGYVALTNMLPWLL